VFSKNWLLRFSIPVLVPRVLYAALSDKKVNRESRSVDRMSWNDGGTTEA